MRSLRRDEYLVKLSIGSWRFEARITQGDPLPSKVATEEPRRGCGLTMRGISIIPSLTCSDGAPARCQHVCNVARENASRKDFTEADDLRRASAEGDVQAGTGRSSLRGFSVGHNKGSPSIVPLKFTHGSSGGGLGTSHSLRPNRKSWLPGCIWAARLAFASQVT